MKNLIFSPIFLMIFCLSSCAPGPTKVEDELTAEQVLEKYYQTISGIENLTYRMHKLDSFLSGEVWDKTGYCILKRDTSDSLFGFLFKGKRDDKDEEVVFYGDEIYEINLKTKEYTIEREEIHRGVLGSTGGQMVLNEIVLKEKDYNQLSLSTTDSSYILRFDYPENPKYNITNRYKELHLNNRTFLPFYMYHTLKSFGDKQVNRATLSDIEVDQADFEDPFLSKEFLKDFSYLQPKKIENKLLTLLNNTAPDLELSDLEGNVSKLSDQKGKVILLDFWEIWCGPCLKSIPRLKEFSERYASEGFEIWSIVCDQNSFDKVKKLSEAMGLNYKVLFGNKELSKQYFVNGVPLYVLVDKAGTVKYAKFGYSSEIEPLIKQELQ